MSSRRGLKSALADPAVDLVALEKEKIRGAIRTDFILSAEIIVITLGTVSAEPFVTQLLVLVTIGLVMTVGVYGLVAGIVKLDDLGTHLIASGSGDAKPTIKQRIGYGILSAAPYLMKFLSIAGTAAMFLVGGGILAHGIPWLHHAVEGLVHPVQEMASFGAILGSLWEMLINAAIGLIGGAIVLLLVTGIKRVRT